MRRLPRDNLLVPQDLGCFVQQICAFAKLLRARRYQLPNYCLYFSWHERFLQHEAWSFLPALSEMICALEEDATVVH